MCEDRKWIDELLDAFSNGNLPEDAIQLCVEHMNRNHRRLYKYYDLGSEYTLPNLELFANYYNDPTKFNDPFDCNIGLSLDQLFRLALPIALRRVYPFWSDGMVDVVTSISLNNIEIDADEKNKENVINECRMLPEFRAMEESVQKGNPVEDLKIAQLLCENPAILKRILIHSTELPVNLTEDEAEQLAAFTSDLMIKMSEVSGLNGVEDEAILKKVFDFFDNKHGIMERVIEAAGLLGVNIDDNVIEKLREQSNDRIAEVHKGVGRAVGIACFAQRWNNVLMWSHYANKHTGICVEYDFDLPFDTASNSLLLPVEYTSMRPLLPVEKLGVIEDGELKVNDAEIASLFSQVLKALITKSEIWEYEQEWRHIVFVKDQEKRLVSLPIISKIIMGVNISDENKKMITEFAEMHSIPLYQARLKEDRYEMVWKRVC